MADIIVDGTVRAYFVASIANNGAPTTTELNGGLALQTTLTMDGLIGFAADTQAVDTTSLASKFSTKAPGRAEYSNTALRLKKQTGTDTIYTTLTPNTAGYIVLRRHLDATTAWTSGQNVEVYPIVCGETRYMDPEPNTVDRYEVPVFITPAPTTRATVA